MSCLKSKLLKKRLWCFKTLTSLALVILRPKPDGVDPSRMSHPFHLHDNPFQVMSRNGQPEPYWIWKNTVLVNGNETVRIRIPFRTSTGKTVYHCHILDHEDFGIMGTVNIQPA